VVLFALSLDLANFAVLESGVAVSVASALDLAGVIFDFYQGEMTFDEFITFGKSVGITAEALYRVSVFRHDLVIVQLRNHSFSVTAGLKRNDIEVVN